MLEVQRQTLKENSEVLASLLTENVPYLLSHYLEQGALTEAEREVIISADSPLGIRQKLIETLADKESLTWGKVLDGLEVTENHSVVAEINSLLGAKLDGGGKGAGDSFVGEDEVASVANKLVDDVIAKAEETTGRMNTEAEVDQKTEEEEESSSIIEAEVEVHSNSNEPIEIKEEDEKEEEGRLKDEIPVPAPHEKERSVSFSSNPVTFIEDKNEVEEESEEEEEEEEGDGNENEDDVPPPIPESPSPSAPSTVTMMTMAPSPAEEYQGRGLDAQDSEEDVDNIDIEKEFVMPPEAEATQPKKEPETEKKEEETNEANNNNNSRGEEQVIIANGNGHGPVKEEQKKNNSNVSWTPPPSSSSPTASELDAILARKALVRQQVEKFEKTGPAQVIPSPSPPAGGKVKVNYSFRTATEEKPHMIMEGERTSNVKNLKNFFQRLSTSEGTNTTSSGAVKPVGKLKVTFPAS